MADNKKWFKVWTTILNDEGFEELSNELVGIWARLGARTALIGTAGQCRFNSKASFVRFLKCKTFEEGVTMVTKLPNLTVTTPPKNDNDTYVVTQFTKWRKYQEDTTTYERQRRYRERVKLNTVQEEEEKRRDKKRQNTVTPFNPKHGTPIKTEPTYFCKICSDQANQPINHKYSEIKHGSCKPKETTDLEPF